jgi:AsmA protein
MATRSGIGRAVNIALIVVVALVVLGAGAFGVAAFSFDPDQLKPRIEAAVKQATGRDLAINGTIGLAWSLWPTVELRDVALANPPGFSRPAMVTLERLKLRLALWPLLRREVEIGRLELVHPDVRLETDAQGRANWVFTPEQRAAAPAQAAPGPVQPPATTQQSVATTEHPAELSAPMRISVRELVLTDGTIAYRDGRTGRDTVLAVQRFAASDESPDAPVRIDGAVSANGTPFMLQGEVGSLARLQDTAATAPWPVKLALASTGAFTGARVAVDGSVAQPLKGKGYDLAVDGAVANFVTLDSVFPKANLPPLHDVTLSGRIVDSGDPVPAITGLTLHAGAGDLGAFVAGLKLAAFDATAPALDQPMHAKVQASLDDAPVALNATLGGLGALLPGAKPAGPFPVDVTAEAAGGTMAASGAVADPMRLAGVDVALKAQVPDLAGWSPFARRALPALRQVAFHGRLTEADGGFSKGATLKGFRLASAQGDVAGDAALALGKPPLLRATLTSDRLDADDLLAVFGTRAPTGSAQVGATAAPAGSPSAAGPSVGLPAGLGPLTGAVGTSSGISPGAPPGPSLPLSPGVPLGASPASPPGSSAGALVSPAPLQATAPSPQAAAPPAPRPARSGQLISDQPLPFPLLLLANADVTLSVADLTWGGADYRGITGHLVLQDGKLRLDPFGADLPTGRLTATLNADAAPKSPPVALTLHAPGLAVASVLAAMELPRYATGTLEAYADLHGAGDSTQALVSRLDGWLGLAMAGGEIDNQVLNATLEPVLRKANLPDVLNRGGTSEIRCVALRMDARHGIGDIRTLLLSTSLLTLDGSGSVNLGDGTLGLRLRPQGRVGGTGFVVPLRVNGSIRAPSFAMDPNAVAQANVGTIIGAVLSKNPQLGDLARLLPGGIPGGAPNGTPQAGAQGGGAVQACPAALAVARGGTPLPEPAAAPAPAPAAAPAQAAPAPVQKPKPPNPAQLLRQFFH